MNGFRFILTTLVAVGLVGCTLQLQVVDPTTVGNSTPESDQSGTGIPSTPFPSRVAPTAAPPTNTPNFGDQGTRIEMAPGGTFASVDGRVSEHGEVSYLVGARANQFMVATLTSTDSSLFLAIQSPLGKILVSPAEQKNSWKGALPEDGDYQVVVFSASGAGDYSLGITIPVILQFKPGGDSQSLDGQISANSTNSYLVRALAGQTITAAIISPGKDIALVISGLQDGRVYAISPSDNPSATVKLPATQNYLVQCVSNGSSSENYQLDIQIK